MISLKHSVAKKIWILMFICASFSSVSYGARVFWNECVDMGGVDIDINTKKCMCVDGKLFDPRKQDRGFICNGVGTKLYHIMLGQGQDYDREGSTGIDVVKKYKSIQKLEYQCTNLLNAACYNSEKSACVCKNNYHIDLKNFWPNTRDCYGTRFVSFGLGSNFSDETATSSSVVVIQPELKKHMSLSERFSNIEWTVLPNEGTPRGRFDGVLEIKDNKTCGFVSGSDTNRLKCSTIGVQNIQFVSIDFSETFDVKNPPSCIAQTIGSTGVISVADITNKKLVLSYVRSQKPANNNVPVGCVKKDDSQPKETYTFLNSNIVKASVQCAFVD